MRYLMLWILMLPLAVAAAAPEENAPAPELHDLYIIPELRGETVDLKVRWTTPTPTRGRVALADGNRVVEEDPSCLRGSTNARDRGEGWANNHRTTLAGVPGRGPWRIRITAVDRQERVAERVATATLEQRAQKGQEGKVALRILGYAPEREGEVAATGIPFPRGVLFDASQLRARAADGRLVPVQAEVWSRWPGDGSIKWVLAALPAPGPEVTLEYGVPAVAPKAPLRVTETPDAITLDTGAARLVVPRREGVAGGFFRGQERRAGFPVSVLVDAESHRLQGRILRAVVENGPAPALRAVVRVDGEHAAQGQARPRYPFTLRIHACAGASGFRIFHTFENDHIAQEMTPFQALELRFPGAVATTVVGERAHPLPAGARLFQQEDNRYVLTAPASGEGKHAAGWVNTAQGARIGVRHFREQYPKSIEAAPDATVIGLLPALPGPIYDGRPEEPKLFAYLRGGRYTFRQGFAKTHELYIDVAGDARAQTRLDEPLVLAAPPEWYARGALRALGPLETEWAGYNAITARNLEMLLERREAERELGLMHFGDWFGERTWNWGNLEYDLHHGLFLQFARTGDRRFFDQAVISARHQMDVDTIHHHREPARVGQQWIHSVMHTAGYYPKEFQGMGRYAAEGWSDNRGHVWAGGLFDAALFTGDRRAWEVATRIADWAAGPQITNFDFGNAREPGWMLILVMSAYNATGDPFYLNAAKRMIERVREKSHPDEGFYAHPLPRGHCECDPPHRGEAGFMMGVLMTGMKMYYEVTGDERVADDIVKAARFLVKTMWEPEKLGFRYTSCPKTNVTYSSATIELEGIAFAARRANDPALAEICQQALAAALPTLSGAGKGMGFYLRSAPQMLDAVAALPGPSFDDYRRRMEALVRSPARRPYPGPLSNPDYEEGHDGWGARTGFSLAIAPEAAHSGRAGARVTGKGRGQNEYLVTIYDTGGTNPMEITGLEPGKTYRVSAWVKVDRITPGAPAPSIRCSIRDRERTRESFVSNAYDLNRLGTWQRLERVFQAPDHTFSAYVAVNTNTREEVEIDLSVDDWSLAPAGPDAAATPARLVADAATATLGEGTTRERIAPPLGFAAVSGGEARWTLQVPREGEYYLWARVAGAGAELRIGNTTVSLKPAGCEWNWVRWERPLRLPAGECVITARLVGKDARLSRIVVTDEALAAR